MSNCASDYWVGWVRYSRKEDGCVTHAYTAEHDKSVCGVRLTEHLGTTLVEAGGVVGCKRCTAALKKIGVLPVALKEVSDHRGNLGYVLAEGGREGLMKMVEAIKQLEALKAEYEQALRESGMSDTHYITTEAKIDAIEVAIERLRAL